MKSYNSHLPPTRVDEPDVENEEKDGEAGVVEHSGSINV
jgi:hypothetical protein